MSEKTRIVNKIGKMQSGCKRNSEGAAQINKKPVEDALPQAF
jgi:hypothetical protein